MVKQTENEALLVKRLLGSNIIANVVGGPVIAAYGGFMMDFVHLSLGRFVLVVLVVMAVNLAFLSIPLNLYLSGRLKRELKFLYLDHSSEQQKKALGFINRLPFIQSALSFIRMLLSSVAVILALGPVFLSALHALAVLCFGLFSSYLVAQIIYFYLQKAASALCSDAIAKLIENKSAANEYLQINYKARHLELVSTFRSILPTIITSLGILFLVLGLKEHQGDKAFLLGRVSAALILNIICLAGLSLITQRYYNKRLHIIQKSLLDIIEHGDIMSNIPTDMRDDYAITAFQINRSFDLFRQILKGLDSAATSISGSVMGFSSQIRETVAATSSQASAVKEMVSAMENSNHINTQIEAKVEELTNQAQSSLEYVNDGFGKIQDTVHKMDDIKKSNFQTLNEIGDLAEELSSIGEIIDIISNIANQTRIIAFNAELEASSAGSAGNSFRIVAEEIRRLANSTVDSLVGIRGRINQIQQGSQRLKLSSEDGTTKIQEGMLLSGDLSNIFMSIRDSSDGTASSTEDIKRVLSEQNYAFEQIFITIKQISEGAEQVMAGTKLANDEVSQLQKLMDELKTTLAHFRFASSLSKSGSAGIADATSGGQS